MDCSYDSERGRMTRPRLYQRRKAIGRRADRSMKALHGPIATSKEVRVSVTDALFGNPW